MGIMQQMREQFQPSPVLADPAQPPRDPRATAAPCPVCGSPGFWLDVYDGGPHCRGCNPPPGPSLVKARVWVVGQPGHQRWEREGEIQPDLADDPGGREVQTWLIDHGGVYDVRVTARRGRVDQSRLVGELGRYSPPLVYGPVGDLTFEEWLDRVEVPWPDQQAVGES